MTKKKTRKRTKKGGSIFLDLNNNRPSINVIPNTGILPKNILVNFDDLDNPTVFIFMLILEINRDQLICQYLFSHRIINNQIVFPQPNTYEGIKYKDLLSYNINDWNSNNCLFVRQNDPYFITAKELWFHHTQEGRDVHRALSPILETRGPPQNGGNKQKLLINDYKKILTFYKLSIPKSRKKLKKKALNTLTKKYCSCLKKVKKKFKMNGREIGICTNSVIKKKGFKRGKFSCKKKRNVDFYKGGKKNKKTRKL